MMTQFWQTNCSSFHQISETPPLLYEVYLFIQTQRTFHFERCIVIHLDWEFSFERCIVGKDILCLRQQYTMAWNSSQKIPDLIIISLNLIYSKKIILLIRSLLDGFPLSLKLFMYSFIYIYRGLVLLKTSQQQLPFSAEPFTIPVLKGSSMKSLFKDVDHELKMCVQKHSDIQKESCLEVFKKQEPFLACCNIHSCWRTLFWWTEIPKGATHIFYLYLFCIIWLMAIFPTSWNKSVKTFDSVVHLWSNNRPLTNICYLV